MPLSYTRSSRAGSIKLACEPHDGGSLMGAGSFNNEICSRSRRFYADKRRVSGYISPCHLSTPKNIISEPTDVGNNTYRLYTFLVSYYYWLKGG